MHQTHTIVISVSFAFVVYRTTHLITYLESLDSLDSENLCQVHSWVHIPIQIKQNNSFMNKHLAIEVEIAKSHVRDTLIIIMYL